MAGTDHKIAERLAGRPFRCIAAEHRSQRGEDALLADIFQIPAMQPLPTDLIHSSYRASPG